MDKIKRARIRVALFAYAYEIKNDSIITDTQYDKEARELDYTTSTDDGVLDNFFRTQYSPDTGMWIYNHPGTVSGELEELYQYLKRCSRHLN